MVIINTIGIYLVVGFLFAIAFVAKGMRVVDKDTIGAPLGFKLLIITGSIVLWPFLLKRWLTARR